MKHVVFALFDDRSAANHAIDHLVREDEMYKEHISLIVHRDAMSQAEFDEIAQHSDLDESDTKHGFALGAWLGATTGAIVGALLAGPLGLFGAGPLVGTVWGAGAGTLYGTLSAGLIGTGLTDHSLERLAERIHAGDVLITVQAPSKEAEERVEATLQKHGAVIAEKHTLA
ncbi:MAG: DUF1269 domain-containing protein [Planctomycetes bacterium]|nr:DUF1269 domain-containing protein [Planctomycetota bacterium]